MREGGKEEFLVQCDTAESASNAGMQTPLIVVACVLSQATTEQLTAEGLVSSSCLNNWINTCVCGLEDLSLQGPMKLGLWVFQPRDYRG